jgi:hypothetical protein
VVKNLGDFMPPITRLSILAAVALAGCASAPPYNGPPGKHLVYVDGQGRAVRQFDYPDDAFCRRVQAIAGRGAHCQPEPAPGLTASATLRYNPPGVLVEGHYADLERCRKDTRTMAPGVTLINACRAR